MTTETTLTDAQIAELERLMAGAWRAPWTARTFEIDCPCPNGDDCGNLHDCAEVESREDYPASPEEPAAEGHGQCVVQIQVPGLEEFALANAQAIAAMRNAYPALLAEVRATRAASRASPDEGRLREAAQRLARLDAMRPQDVTHGSWACAFRELHEALRSAPPAPTEETRVWVPHSRSCISLGTPGLACDCGRACVECDGARAVDTVDRRIPCPSCTVTAAAPPPEDSGAREADLLPLCPDSIPGCGCQAPAYAPATDNHIVKRVDDLELHWGIRGIPGVRMAMVAAYCAGSSDSGSAARCPVCGTAFHGKGWRWTQLEVENHLRACAPASSKEGGRHE